MTPHTNNWIEEKVEILMKPALLYQKYARDDGSTELSEAEFRKVAREVLTEAREKGVEEACKAIAEHFNSQNDEIQEIKDTIKQAEAMGEYGIAKDLQALLATKTPNHE